MNLTDQNQSYDERLERLSLLKRFLYDIRDTSRMVLKSWSATDDNLFNQIVLLIENERDRIHAEKSIEKILRGE